jgi:hypothetical protein
MAAPGKLHQPTRFFYVGSMKTFEKSGKSRRISMLVAA